MAVELESRLYVRMSEREKQNVSVMICLIERRRLTLDCGSEGRGEDSDELLQDAVGSRLKSRHGTSRLGDASNSARVALGGNGFSVASLDLGGEEEVSTSSGL